MNKLFNRAATALRSAFKADSDTSRYLEKIHVDVRRSGRHWGA